MTATVAAFSHQKARGDGVLRRWFRIGLRMGIVLGVVLAIAKTVQSRRSEPLPVPSPGPWPPLPEREPRTDPVVHQPATPPAPEHVVADLEPEPEPEPVVAAGLVEAEQLESDEAAARHVTKAAKKTRKVARKRAKVDKPAAAWVDPDGGVCPVTHPVKAKLASKIFHLPGMLNYKRTRPDRCYRDAGAAESDGLRPAKR